VATAALACCADGAVAVVKPAQTGVADGEPGDLAEVARLAQVGSLHEFARYPQPLAPERAAALSGRPALRLEEVAARIRDLAATHRHVLVEGAGGLLVRYAPDGWTIADLAVELTAPAVVVVAAGLGTLNHTALTLEAMHRRGVRCAGVVIGSWPADPGLAERCNLVDLPRIAGAPLAGVLPEKLARVPDFAVRARAALAPQLGGTFVGALGAQP
jgi:dethiobiotin synthase